MSFGAAVRDGFSNYARFSGRSPRSGYWWWVLFVVGGRFVTAFLDLYLFGSQSGNGADSLGTVEGLFLLAVGVPSVAVMVRRLHDSDLRGWWAIAAIVPFVGSFIFLIYITRPSTPGPNRFGPATTGAAALAEAT